MSNKIYTIGREFGSGGKAVGEALANRLGIKLYDKELLQQAAKDSGFCEEIFENHDEKPTSSFLYSLVMDTYSVGSYNSSTIKYSLHNLKRSKRLQIVNPVSLLADVQITHWQIIRTASIFLYIQIWKTASKLSANA